MQAADRIHPETEHLPAAHLSGDLMTDRPFPSTLEEMGRNPLYSTTGGADRDRWDYARFLLANGGASRGGVGAMREAGESRS